MTKESFLTVRWNNIISLGMGMIPLIWIAIVLSTSLVWVKAGFIGIVIIGVIY